MGPTSGRGPRPAWAPLRRIAGVAALLAVLGGPTARAQPGAATWHLGDFVADLPNTRSLLAVRERAWVLHTRVAVGALDTVWRAHPPGIAIPALRTAPGRVSPAYPEGDYRAQLALVRTERGVILGGIRDRFGQPTMYTPYRRVDLGFCASRLEQLTYVAGHVHEHADIPEFQAMLRELRALEAEAFRPDGRMIGEEESVRLARATGALLILLNPYVQGIGRYWDLSRRDFLNAADDPTLFRERMSWGRLARALHAGTPILNYAIRLGQTTVAGVRLIDLNIRARDLQRRVERIGREYARIRDFYFDNVAQLQQNHCLRTLDGMRVSVMTPAGWRDADAILTFAVSPRRGERHDPFGGQR